MVFSREQHTLYLRAGLLAMLAVSMLLLPCGDLRALELGDEAPAFALKDLSGRTISLAALRGRVVLLHFWSVLCRPCIKEMPELNRLQEHYKRDQVQVLAVSIDTPQRVRDFAKENDLELTILIDSDKEVFFDAYGGPALPTSFLIDSSGILRDRLDGPEDWNSQALRKRLQKLLPEKQEGK